MHQNNTFEILLVGDAGVGKTTWVKRLATGEFQKTHEQTMENKIIPLTFYTNYGVVTFNVCEKAERTTVDARKSDGVVVMSSFTSKKSLERAESYGGLKEGIPTLLVVNKYDEKVKEVKKEEVTEGFTGRQVFDAAFSVSAKTNYNFEKPFLFLAKRLMGKEDLIFVEAPAVIPPTASIE